MPDLKLRSVLMSALHTLNKRRGDQSLESIFKNLLDELAKNPTVQIASLFPLPKSIPRNFYVEKQVPIPHRGRSVNR